jgi:uncharacterized protein (DUF305 family)
MNKNVSLIVAAAVALALGFGIGYASAGPRAASIPSGMHRMADGSMMGNSKMSMQDMMRDMAASLEGKTGDEFDRAFLEEMIVHHEGAVLMAEAALQNAERQEIKDLSVAIIAAQNREIADMKSWLSTWYR